MSVTPSCALNEPSMNSTMECTMDSGWISTSIWSAGRSIMLPRIIVPTMPIDRSSASRSTGGRLWPSDGGPPVALERSDDANEISYSPRGDLVAHTMGAARQTIGLWSAPDGRFLRSFDLGDDSETYYLTFSDDGKRLLTSSNATTQRSSSRERGKVSA